MKFRPLLALAVLVTLLLPTPTAHATKKRNLVKSPGPPIVFEVATAEPELGTEVQALPGETLYTEFQGFEQKAAVMEEELEIWDDHTVREGEVLLGYIGNKDREIYCSPFRNRKIKLAWTQFNGWDCLIRTSTAELPTYRFDNKQVYQLEGDHGPKVGLKKKLPVFRYTRVVPEPEDAAWIAEENGFEMWRKRIVYLGTAAGVLRVAYEEYGEDLSTPTTSQELTYDLPEDLDAEPLVVSIRGARLEIQEVGSRGLRYRVVQGFDG